MCICCILVETDGKQIGIFETACQKYSWSRRTEDVGLFGSKTIDSQKKMDGLASQQPKWKIKINPIHSNPYGDKNHNQLRHPIEIRISLLMLLPHLSMDWFQGTCAGKPNISTETMASSRFTLEPIHGQGEKRWDVDGLLQARRGSADGQTLDTAGWLVD